MSAPPEYLQKQLNNPKTVSEPLRLFGPNGEVVKGPELNAPLPLVVLGPNGEIVWSPERNVFPDFKPVSPSLKNVAIEEAARLSQQLGIPIRADRMLEAPWTGRIYTPTGDYTGQSNSMGWERNESRFWSEYKRQYPDDFKLLNADGTISVEFAKKMGWPTEGPNSVVGDKMEHHHVSNGTLVAPVPSKLHEKESGKIHGKVGIGTKGLTSGPGTQAKKKAITPAAVQAPAPAVEAAADGKTKKKIKIAPSKIPPSVEKPIGKFPAPAPAPAPPKKAATPGPVAKAVAGPPTKKTAPAPEAEVPTGPKGLKGSGPMNSIRVPNLPSKPALSPVNIAAIENVPKGSAGPTLFNENTDVKMRALETKLLSIAKLIGLVFKIGSEILNVANLISDGLEGYQMAIRPLRTGGVFTEDLEMAISLEHHVSSMNEQYGKLRLEFSNVHQLIYEYVDDKWARGLLSSKINNWLSDLKIMSQYLDDTISKMDDSIKFVQRKKEFIKNMRKEPVTIFAFSLINMPSSLPAAKLYFFMADADEILATFVRTLKVTKAMQNPIRDDIELLEALYLWNETSL